MESKMKNQITSRTLSRRDMLRAAAAASLAVVPRSMAGGAKTPEVSETPSSQPGKPASAAPAKPAADRWQLGFYTRFWNGFYYLLAMDAVAEIGCKYIGLMTHTGKTRLVLSNQSTLEEAAKVGGEAKQRGLSIPSIYFGGFDLTQRDKAVAELRHFIDLAVAADARSILLCGPDRPEQFDLYHGAVAEGCDYALTKNVAVTIKPHGPLVENSPQLRNTVEKVGRGNFSVYYDPGNVFFYSRGKLNPIDDVSGVDGLATGLIIKDYRSEAGGEGSVSLTPGTGDVDFPGVFFKLKKGGFTSGPLLVEPPIGGDYSQIVGEARKVRRLLEDLVR